MDKEWVQIQQDIDWLKQNADGDDVVVIYYSGHGIRRDDADPASSDEPLNEFRQDNDIPDYNPPAVGPMDEGVTMQGDVFDDQLGAALGGGWKSEGIGIILIFDSCFSRGMIDGGKDPGATLSKIANPNIILMAAEKEYWAYVRHDVERSVFTYYLLEGLTGLAADADVDGILTAEELFDYAAPKTEEYVHDVLVGQNLGPNPDDDSDWNATTDDLDGNTSPSTNWDGAADGNGDGDPLYDPEPHVDEDTLDGVDNDGDGSLNEDLKEHQTPSKTVKGLWEHAPHKHLDAEPPALVDLEAPLGTQWHELYPEHCNRYRLAAWDDDGDSVLGPLDQVVIRDVETGELGWHHVEYVTVTIVVSRKPDLVETMYLEYEYAAAGEASGGETDAWLGELDDVLHAPVCTLWHEVHPGYCCYYHLSSWEDNGDGVLSPSDQIDLTPLPEGPVEWYHVDAVKTDLVVSVKRVAPPVGGSLTPVDESRLAARLLLYAASAMATASLAALPRVKSRVGPAAGKASRLACAWGGAYRRA